MLSPSARDEIDRLTKSLEAELIEFRRGMHRHPELGHEEHLTTASLVRRLTEAGLEPRILSCGTGLVCDVVGASGEPPVLGFRADIDALPLQDVKQVPYRSQREGICHACGHDAHTAVVLGTALVLADLRRQGLLHRSVRLIFQPAEELTPGGALDVLADGEIDGLQRVFALHCEPRIEVGKLGFRSGAITAGADRIRVEMRGPGGHTARPHLTADLVYALGSIITELPGLLSRLADPRAGLSVVWGQVHAGRVANAIPQQGFAEGTIRCLDARVSDSAHSMVPDLVRSLVSPYGVDVEVDMHRSVPPCVNDEVSTDLMRAVARDVFGTDQVTTIAQSLGGEDFAWILERVPGALVRLGVRKHELADGGDLHRGSFDLDEAAIAVGVRLFSSFALATGRR
jgi:amidohydrolase